MKPNTFQSISFIKSWWRKSKNSFCDFGLFAKEAPIDEILKINITFHQQKNQNEHQKLIH
jgi:hypothetical protein